MTREPLTCRLCDVTDWSVRPRLIEWALSDEHPMGMSYEQVDRCLDAATCRGRVEARGETWPEAERDERRTG